MQLLPAPLLAELDRLCAAGPSSARSGEARSRSPEHSPAPALALERALARPGPPSPPVPGGPRRNAQRLRCSLPSHEERREWAVLARLEVLVSTMPSTRQSLMSGIRCWLDFAMDVLGRKRHLALPPSEARPIRATPSCAARGLEVRGVRPGRPNVLVGYLHLRGHVPKLLRARADSVRGATPRHERLRQQTAVPASASRGTVRARARVARPGRPRQPSCGAAGTRRANRASFGTP